MRTKLLIVGMIVAVASVIGIVATSSYNVQAQNRALVGQTIPVANSQTPDDLGLPAIQPTLPKSSSPRFTTADVRAYLHTHPFMGGPTVKGATSTIAEITFITAKQASTLIHGEPTGLPDTALVCYVKLQGPFMLVNASEPPGAKAFPPVAFGIEIFDGQTGNLLMWWAP